MHFFKALHYHSFRCLELAQRSPVMLTGDMVRKKKLLWELFDGIHAYLTKHDITHWLVFGTLLGYFRENEIIEHDLDIDFGCNESEYTKLLSCIKKDPPPFAFRDTSWRHYGPKVYFTHKGYDLDLYFFKRDEQLIHSYEKTEWANYTLPIPEKYVFPLQPVVFNGRTCMAPKQIENYLKFVYGSIEKEAKRNPITGFWES